MTEQKIPLHVQQIVAEVFSLPVEGVTGESSPETIAGWDSVGHLNLVLALEQEFHVQFSPDEIERMVSVGRIIQVLIGGHGAPVD